MFTSDCFASKFRVVFQVIHYVTQNVLGQLRAVRILIFAKNKRNTLHEIAEVECLTGNLNAAKIPISTYATAQHCDRMYIECDKLLSCR